MALIAIVFSLILERFLGTMEELRRFEWFLSYRRWLVSKFSRFTFLQGHAGLALILLPVVIPLVLVDFYLGEFWLLLELAFAVLVLLYCYGPRDLEAEVEAFVDARQRNDEESACWHAAELLGGEPLENSAGISKRIMENIFTEANDRLLAVIFWFVVAGPTGALLFRLSSIMSRHSVDEGNPICEAGEQLHQLLLWLPARLCAIAYALAGSFVEAIHGWRGVELNWLQSSRAVLIASGFGALRISSGDIEDDSQESEQVVECMALVRRAALVFLTVVALLTLAGLMS